MRSIVFRIFAIGLLPIGQTLAAPLEAKQVAADATWLVHFDVDAIRASIVVQKAWQKVLEQHPDTEAHLRFVRIVIGTDLGSDVHGITIYNRANGGGKAVAIVAAAMDPERITLLSSLIPGRETTVHDDYTIQSWTPKYRDRALTIACAFRGREQLLLASSVEDVKGSLDVLDGKAPGLNEDASLGGNIPVGTAFLVRAEGPAEPKRPGEAPSKPIGSFRMVMGESDGQSFWRARVTMADPESVAYTLTAIHSGQALSNLLCSDELGRKLVNAVQSTSNGQTVTILWSAPAADVWDGLLKIERAVKRQIARLLGRDKLKAADNEEGNAPAVEGTPANKTVRPEEDF